MPSCQPPFAKVNPFPPGQSKAAPDVPREASSSEEEMRWRKSLRGRLAGTPSNQEVLKVTHLPRSSKCVNRFTDYITLSVSIMPE